ncbi:MAG: hypothetical protein ACFFDT_27565 [Candidatus Hodarchaeota archaeon]
MNLKLNKIFVLFLALINCVFSTTAFSQLEVIESTFCLKMDKPDCEIPCVAEQISLEQIKTTEGGEKRLYFWTRIKVMENRNITHAWKATNRKDEWAEKVHVSWSDKMINLTSEVLAHTKEFLKVIFKSDSDTHSIQGVMLPLYRSPCFRTYSSIIAKPGIYSVTVYDLNYKVVPGGETRTIRVVQ